MSVLERLREVFNLRAFAEEVRYTHTLSYSFVNSGPVSQPFSLSLCLSVSLLPPLPLFFFLSSKSASSGFEEERKERKRERYLVAVVAVKKKKKKKKKRYAKYCQPTAMTTNTHDWRAEIEENIKILSESVRAACPNIHILISFWSSFSFSFLYKHLPKIYVYFHFYLPLYYYYFYY